MEPSRMSYLKTGVTVITIGSDAAIDEVDQNKNVESGQQKTVTFRESLISSIPLSPPRGCDSHTAGQCQYFCNDCTKKLCDSCLIVHTKQQHKVISLVEVIAEKRQVFEARVGSLDSEVHSRRRIVFELSTHREEANRNYAAARQKVIEWANGIRQTVHNTENQLLNDILTQENHTLGVYNDRSASLEFEVAAISTKTEHFRTLENNPGLEYEQLVEAIVSADAAIAGLKPLSKVDHPTEIRVNVTNVNEQITNAVILDFQSAAGDSYANSYLWRNKSKGEGGDRDSAKSDTSADRSDADNYTNVFDMIERQAVLEDDPNSPSTSSRDTDVLQNGMPFPTDTTYHQAENETITNGPADADLSAPTEFSTPPISSALPYFVAPTQPVSADFGIGQNGRLELQSVSEAPKYWVESSSFYTKIRTDRKEPLLSAIAVSDSNIVVVDTKSDERGNSKVKSFNVRGKLEWQIPMKDKVPYDVAAYSDIGVVVSRNQGRSHTLEIYDMGGKKIKTMKTKTRDCHNATISICGKTVAVISQGDKDVLMYNVTNGKPAGTLSAAEGHPALQQPQHVHLTKLPDDRIIVSDHAQLIQAFTLEGEGHSHIFTYDPRVSGNVQAVQISAITTDLKGNTVVADYLNRHLHVISPQGQFLGLVRTSIDHRPVGLAATPGGQLAVAHETGHVHLYKQLDNGERKDKDSLMVQH